MNSIIIPFTRNIGTSLKFIAFLYDFLSIFYQAWIKVFNVNHVIKKVICTIFNINLFDISH